MTDMTFSCACGTVAGSIAGVGPKQDNYVYCRCTDYQAVPRLLGRRSAFSSGQVGQRSNRRAACE